MRTKTRKEFRSFIIKNLALPEEYSKVLSDSAKYNTYVETISNKADNLHVKIKQEYIETIHASYSDYAKNLLRKQRFGLVDIICDVTSEDFYGKIAGLHIHPWTGENGVEGKFHYLVVGILFRNKILPFYAILLRLGCSKAKLIGKAISYCHSLGLKISKILLDRGFYSGEVIERLQIEKVNYLIFAKKSSLFRYMLEGAEGSCIIEHEMKYNKDFTWNKVRTDIALVKGVLDYDWIFATNLIINDIEKYVEVYRKRWNIETMFRVHDEARIKTKSKNPIIRLFYFIMGMLLVLLWNLHLKQKMTFKLFVIMLMETGKEKTIRGKY
jgi:hypothetical protein|tara:strand:- start:393 stop:1370 length:978 start_codon:yes stop_codon:yes gene_type:complete